MFVHGGYEGLIMGATIRIVLLVVTLVGGAYYMYWDHNDMKHHHCEVTNENREAMIWMTTYDGNGNAIGGYPYFYTEWMYHCDDHPRWR